jgi:hypothetical protein
MDDEFDKALEAALDDAEEALNKGKYKQSLKALLSLSMSDIKSSVPKASYAEYSKLISVVEQASAKNVAQAELVNSIKALGKRVVSIAKLVPGLASIL